MKATLTIKSYDVAKDFAKAWSRYSKCGYSLGAKNVDGGAELTLYGIKETDKAWIESNVAALNAE